MKKNFVSVLIIIILIVPLFAFAQTNPCAINTAAVGTSSAASLPKCVNKIYVWALGLSVILALLMLILGGYYVMTARGNAEQASKGKEFIASALVGVVLLFAAYLLLNQINPNLVKFDYVANDLQGLNSQQTCGQPQPRVCP